MYMLLVRCTMLQAQVRAIAGLMETDMHARFHPEDAIRIGRALINTDNPLRIPPTASALDPRTKSCLWAYNENIAP